MSMNSKAASAATAKPCPNVDRYREVETPHGKVIIRSLHASLTRDAAQAVSAFFENEKNGFKPALTISPSWATETLLDDHMYSLGDTALVITGPSAELRRQSGLSDAEWDDLVSRMQVPNKILQAIGLARKP